MELGINTGGSHKACSREISFTKLTDGASAFFGCACCATILPCMGLINLQIPGFCRCTQFLHREKTSHGESKVTAQCSATEGGPQQTQAAYLAHVVTEMGSKGVFKHESLGVVPRLVRGGNRSNLAPNGWLTG